MRSAQHSVEESFNRSDQKEPTGLSSGGNCNFPKRRKESKHFKEWSDGVRAKKPRTLSNQQNTETHNVQHMSKNVVTEQDRESAVERVKSPDIYEQGAESSRGGLGTYSRYALTLIKPIR